MGALVIDLMALVGELVEGNVKLTADDGLDVVIFTGLVELDGSVHGAMIRDRDGRRALFNRFFNVFFRLRKAIQNGIVSVNVKIDELGLGHRENASNAESRLT